MSSVFFFPVWFNIPPSLSQSPYLTGGELWRKYKNLLLAYLAWVCTYEWLCGCTDLPCVCLNTNGHLRLAKKTCNMQLPVHVQGSNSWGWQSVHSFLWISLLRKFPKLLTDSASGRAAQL